jgi:hypothetical protein
MRVHPSYYGSEHQPGMFSRLPGTLPDPRVRLGWQEAWRRLRCSPRHHTHTHTLCGCHV